jgi:hypothetical protein
MHCFSLPPQQQTTRKNQKTKGGGGWCPGNRGMARVATHPPRPVKSPRPPRPAPRPPRPPRPPPLGGVPLGVVATGLGALMGGGGVLAPPLPPPTDEEVSPVLGLSLIRVAKGVVSGTVTQCSKVTWRLRGLGGYMGRLGVGDVADSAVHRLSFTLAFRVSTRSLFSVRPPLLACRLCWRLARKG